MPPRVLFGTRAGADVGSDATDSDASSVLLSASGAAPGLPPVHMSVEAADPRSALRAARTYLLTAGQMERDVFAGEGTGVRRGGAEGGGERARARQEGLGVQGSGAACR